MDKTLLLTLTPSFFFMVDYDNAMGRIIAVNLAHWRKDQEKRTKEPQDKREYHANVQEIIETTNEGTFQTLFVIVFVVFCCCFREYIKMNLFISRAENLHTEVLAK